jgi:hypothetical protein
MSTRPSDPTGATPVDRAGVARRDGPKGRKGLRSRRVAVVYVLLSGIMAPWIVYLAAALPERNLAHNYDVAWVGFDSFLLIAMASTAWLAARRSPRIGLPAAATAVLLLVDAWFDVVTAAPGAERIQALLLALLVELPGAALSAIVAHRAHVRLTAFAPTNTSPRKAATTDPLG